MSPESIGEHVGEPGFPRVSGDEPTACGILYGLHKFSPRERG